jgi:hypothetical protein
MVLVEPNIMAVSPAQLCQRPQKYLQACCRVRTGAARKHTNYSHGVRVLCACCKRPLRGKTANISDEVSSPHELTPRPRTSIYSNTGKSESARLQPGRKTLAVRESLRP